MGCFLVADETAVLGVTLVTLTPPPTLTPLPDALTPVLCNESLPRVGRNRVEAGPSAASLTRFGPSTPLPSCVTFNLTLSSRPLPFAIGVDAFPFPLDVLGPAVAAVSFDVSMTL